MNDVLDKLAIAYDEIKSRVQELAKAYDEKNHRVRELYRSYAQEIETNDCRRMLRCVLIPFKDTGNVKCSKQTGDHLIEDATVKHLLGYSHDAAPTALVEGPSYHIGTHGLEHSGRTMAARKRKGEGEFTLQDSADLAAKQHCETFPNAACNEKCISKQLVKGHEKMGIKPCMSVEEPTLHSDHSETFKKDIWDDFNTNLAKKRNKLA